MSALTVLHLKVWVTVLTHVAVMRLLLLFAKSVREHALTNRTLVPLYLVAVLACSILNIRVGRYEVLVTLACLTLMHHILLLLNELILCGAILLESHHVLLLLHLHNLLVLLSLLVLRQNEWICTIGHPSGTYKTRLLRRLASLLFRGCLWRGEFIGNILVSSDFRIHYDLVVEMLDNFAGSFVIGELDFDLRFFELHVAVFDLIRWKQLEDGISQFSRYIPLHVGAADDHGA